MPPKKVLVLCVLFTIFLLCSDSSAQQDSLEDDSTTQEPSREQRNLQDWKAVDYFALNSEASGWVPSTETEQEEPKRRRIRKRKRRPPTISLTETEQAAKKPQRLDQVHEPWDQIEEEGVQKPSVRRRLTPVFQEELFEKIRDPFTALQEEEEKQRKRQEEEAKQPQLDLKTLLKQSGGLSLSEVLQQKNLSLSELLNGNKQAISALAETAETTTTTTETPKVIINEKYKRLPPSVGLRKNIDRNYEQTESSQEALTSQEMLDAQRKRLSLLHKDNKLFSDVTKFDVVTEEVTERRIFIPSEDLEHVKIETTPSPVPSSTPHPKSKPKLPVTSARLKPKPSIPTSTIPPKAVKINVNEIFGFTVESSTKETGPLKMVIDLDDISLGDQTTKRIDVEKTTISDEWIKRTEKRVTSIPIEKLKHVTAKEEIMEILRNPSDRATLSRILQNRNMTVEELVEQRERGSSQLHLADIFHNKTREPEPKEEEVIGQMPADYFNNFPIFRRQKSERVTEKPKQMYTITSFPTYKIESKPFLPIWKDFYNDLYQNKNQETPVVSSTSSYDDLQRLEDVENKLVESSNDQLNIDMKPVVDEEEFINLPSGVKSAMLASFVIIGISLLVFLTILIIFKWTQKKKRRGLNYCASFSGSRIKSPILEPIHRRSLRSFVNETLGRKKNYYKSHLQSMSDSIWDNEKKPYM